LRNRDRKNYERCGKNCSGTKRCTQENILTISLPQKQGKKCENRNKPTKIWMITISYFLAIFAHLVAISALLFAISALLVAISACQNEKKL
jgi:hypothetical protein